MPLPEKVAVSTIKPEGYLHSRTFDEVYETVALGLEHLGIAVDRLENRLSHSYPTILFGGHLLDQPSLRKLAPTTIFYNLEQVDESAPWMSTPYRQAMRLHEVWDFNEINARRLLEDRIASNVVWAPIGYVEEMTRITSVPDPDIDVLFYGSMNPRRYHVLESLKTAGLNVVHAFGVYGPDRDQLIARSKVLLNVHYYETGIFEWVRVFYLLANNKTIVSENSILTGFDLGIEQVITFSRYEDLVQTCQNAVQNFRPTGSMAVATKAYLHQHREDLVLQSVIAASPVMNGRLKELDDRLSIKTKHYTYEPPVVPSDTVDAPTISVNDHKVSFICCINDRSQFALCDTYLEKLVIPPEFSIDIITVENAPSMTSGYNFAMTKSNAKYKVYLHQDVYVTNSHLLFNIGQLFTSYPNIGMLGVIGAQTIPPNGVWWESPDCVGKVMEIRSAPQLLNFGDLDNPYSSVQGLDGLILITQYDLPWRDDLFSSQHFYDLSQCFEFIKAGYEVVIPKQEEAWCIHDRGPVSNLNGFEDSREIFIRNYL